MVHAIRGPAATQAINDRPSGLLLERPINFRGPKSNNLLKARFIAKKPVQFFCLLIVLSYHPYKTIGSSNTVSLPEHNCVFYFACENVTLIAHFAVLKFSKK